MKRLEIHPHLLEKCSYAVVDPAQVDASSWNHLPVQSLAPPAYARLALQLPYVLPLRHLDAGERGKLLAMALDREASEQSPIFCILIASSETPGSVIRHLSRMMMVHSPTDGKAYQLRYHDAYTLMQLSWILDPGQQKTLLGQSEAWMFPLQGWWRLEPLKNAAAAPSLRLSSEQWQQLRYVGTANVALARQNASADDRPALGKKLYPWIVTAHSVGLTDEEDVIAFATHGLTHHPRFYRHRHILGLLAQCEGQPKRYLRMTSALSEAQWRGIAADMSESSSQL